MSDIQLPRRMFREGEHPKGGKANAYMRVDFIKDLVEVLDESELKRLKDAGFSGLFELLSKPNFSRAFILMLLSRQLEVSAKKEIWLVFAGHPIRISLRELSIVTGLRCDKYPALPRMKKKDTMQKVYPFYGTLFGLEKEVTVERVVQILRARKVTDPELRIRYAALVLVDGVLLSRNHKKGLVSEVHAEMCRDLNSFLNYPWGRRSFEAMVDSIKERTLWQLAFSAIAVKGFAHAIQLIVLEAIPSIQVKRKKRISSDDEIEDETAEIEAGDDGSGQDKGGIALEIQNARDLDRDWKENPVEVEAIIYPDHEFVHRDEDLTWPGELSDPSVENLVSVVNGKKFKPGMLTGGRLMSRLPKPAKKNPDPKTNKGRAGKGKGKVRQGSGSRGSSRDADLDEDEFVSECNPASSDVREYIDRRIAERVEHLKSDIMDSVETIVKSSEQTVINAVIAFFKSSPGFPARSQGVSPKNPVGRNENQESNPSHHSSTQYISETRNKDPPIDPSHNSRSKSAGVIESDGNVYEDAVDQTQEENDNFDHHREDDIVSGDAVDDHQPGDNATHSKEDAQPANEPTQSPMDIDEANNEKIMPPKSPTITVSDADREKATKVLSVLRNTRIVANQAIADKVEAVLLAHCEPPQTREATTTEDPESPRLSKRPRTVSSVLDERYEMDTETKILIGHPKNKKPADQTDISSSAHFDAQLQRLNVIGSFTLPDDTTITYNSIYNVVVKKRPITAKLMEKISFFALFDPIPVTSGSQVTSSEILPPKFIQSLFKLGDKFEKSVSKDLFVFPKRLLSSFTSGDGSGLYPSFDNATAIYIPCTIGADHWVVVCVNQTNRSFEVLDCNAKVLTDAELEKTLCPPAMMFPYLWKKAASPSALTQEDVISYTITRSGVVPQISSLEDSGLVSLVILKYHAYGSLAGITNWDYPKLLSEARNLVANFIEDHLGPAINP